MKSRLQVFAEIEDDLRPVATGSGVNGTPTFYVNGSRYNDSWDLETLLENLRNAINEAPTNS